MTPRISPVKSPDSWRFVLPILLAYIALGVFLCAHHEAWRDEADSWLLARDASLSEAWNRFGYKGTPGLWTFILMPFAKAGLPFETAGYVHLLLASAVVLVLLRHSPFPRGFRVLMVFSYLLGYEYLAIARNYAIGVFFLFVLAALDRRRVDWPLRYGLVLGLLANCNVHSLIIAASIGLTFVIDAWMRGHMGRGVVAGAAVALGFGLLAVAQVWPPVDGAHAGLVHSEEWRALRWTISQSIFPGIRVGGLHWIAFPVFIIGIASAWRHRRAMATFSLGFTGLVYVFTFKVVGGARHFGLVYMLLVWALWISYGRANRRLRAIGTTVLGLCLAIGVGTAAFFWANEYCYPFSGAKEMAGYLERSGLAESEIAVHLPASGSAVLAYMNVRRTFSYPALGEHGSYMLWDRRYEAADRVSHETIARRVRDSGSTARLLLNEPLHDPGACGYVLRYASRPDVFEKLDEVFYLYEPARSGPSTE